MKQQHLANAFSTGLSYGMFFVDAKTDNETWGKVNKVGEEMRGYMNILTVDCGQMAQFCETQNITFAPQFFLYNTRDVTQYQMPLPEIGQRQRKEIVEFMWSNAIIPYAEKPSVADAAGDLAQNSDSPKILVVSKTSTLPKSVWEFAAEIHSYIQIFVVKGATDENIRQSEALKIPSLEAN